MKFPLGTILGLLAAMFTLAALLFPSVTVGGNPDSPKAQAKNDVLQLATAIKAYEVEYGHLPGTNRGIVGKELMDTLMGTTNALNPRAIVFIEVKQAKNGKGGVTPEGIFVDPWGGPYQVAFASGANSIVTNAGLQGVEVRQRVAVWNDPSLGKGEPWWTFTKSPEPRRRAVTSWD